MSAPSVNPGRWWLVCLAGLVGIGPAVGQPAPEPLPPVLTLDAAVGWALRNHPELAALRQQHGIAAANVVIADTYPFNPVSETRAQVNSGPESAAITNAVALEQFVLLEVEVHHQRSYRRQEAAAALGRTGWEIAAQEQAAAVRVIRAFHGLIYRREKLRLVAETLRLNEQLVEQVRHLMDAGRLRGADLLLARTEVVNVRAIRGASQAILERALAEFYRALGVVCGPVELVGSLDMPPLEGDCDALMEAALGQRPDLQARQAAIAEAEARVRLETANRWGNPIVGPAFTYDPTRVSEIGAQVNIPLPLFNTRKGEILRAEAERTRAALQLRHTEVLVRQDVQAALARLTAARTLADTYRRDVLPELRQALDGIQRLLAQGEPGVDVLRVIDIQRKLLQARDGYLDALWEMSEARADLAAALGDPRFVVPSCENTPSTLERQP